MGLSSSKSKSTNEPAAWAKPYIIKGLEQTSQVFDANQPRLQDMSNIAYDAFKTIAPDAFGVPNQFVKSAQNSAQAIGSGAFLGTNPGQSTYDRMQQSAGGGQGLLGGRRRATPVGGGVQVPAFGGGIQAPNDPSMGLLQGMASNTNAAPGTDTLNRLAQGGTNPADRFASGVAGGKYLNNQPSAGLYSDIMSSDYLKGNPYLDDMIAQTNANVTKDANRLFSARGMGSGIGSAFADVLSKNLANNEGSLRYQNYNDAANRQLTAAGQSDAAWSGERGRMDASTGLLASNYNAAQDRALAAAQGLNSAAQQGDATRLAAAQALGGQFNAGQDRALSRYTSDADRQLQYYTGDQNRALERYTGDQNRALQAAQASDAAQQSQVQQLLTALGLTGDLREADYAGIAPALSLLNTAADIPYVGTAALNGQIRQGSGGYGTTTTKTGMNLGQTLLGAAAQAGSAYLGRG